MMFLDRLNKALKKRGTLIRIAEISGLSEDGVRKIAYGRTPNPGILTVQAIERALDQIEHAETMTTTPEDRS